VASEVEVVSEWDSNIICDYKIPQITIKITSKWQKNQF